VKPSKKKKLPIHSGRRQMKFPQVKGKNLEEVDFSADSEDHSITLVFRDKTALRFDIEPGFYSVRRIIEDRKCAGDPAMAGCSKPVVPGVRWFGASGSSGKYTL
jgi:hypothetical protein